MEINWVTESTHEWRLKKKPLINCAFLGTFVIQSRVLPSPRFHCAVFYAGRLTLMYTSDIVRTKVARNRSEIRRLPLSLFSRYVIFFPV